MTQPHLLAATAALLLGAGTALAAEPASKERVATPNPNEVVCEKVEVIGSRLGAKKVCMTRAQWAERQLLDRQDLEKTQVQRGYQGQ
jgi:hypothetical protein